MNSPSEVFRLLRETVVDGYDIDGQVDLYAVDGVLEMPFAPPGTPREIRGREEIRKSLVEAVRSARKAGIRVLGDDPIVVHQTADPEVIVAEFELHGKFADNTEFRMPFIQVLRVRDGEIVSMRDYYSSEAMEAILGTETRGVSG